MYYEDDTNYLGVNTRCFLSFETIGIITGIILCILQGTGTINIGWFWATFPFWIPFAVDFVIVILIVIITLIYLTIINKYDK